MDVSIESLSLRELWGRGKWDCKSQWGREPPRKQDLWNTAWLMHIWTHRDISSTHRVCKGSNQMWEMETHSPILTKTLSPTDIHFQRKIYFSPMDSLWVYKPHSRAGPRSSSRWTQWYFGRFFFLSHNIWSIFSFSFLLVFNYTGILLIYDGFQFCVIFCLFCSILNWFFVREREKVRRCGVGRVRRWRGYGGDEERKKP